LNLSKQFIETIRSTTAKWPLNYSILKLNVQKPYLIRNRTGHTVSIWGESAEVEESAEIESGQDIPWRFENWQTMRDSTQQIKHRLVIHVHCSAWETLSGVNVDREQRLIYPLRPTVNDRLNRLCVDVKVKDKIKVVTLKSLLSIINSTLINIEILLNGSTTIVPPKGEFCIPIINTFDASLQFRPERSFGYLWSKAVSWVLIKDHSTLDLVCRPTSEGRGHPFNFILHGEQDRKVTYPKMEIIVSCPIELENLLPYDCLFQVIDPKAGLPISSEMISSGATASLGFVNIRSSLGVHIRIPDLCVSSEKAAFIPSLDEADLGDEEDSLQCEKNICLQLHMHPILNTGGSRLVSLYCPIVVQNTLGVDISLRDKYTLCVPAMCIGLFSDKRPSLAIPGSDWSQSFAVNTLTTNHGIMLTSQDESRMWYIGVHVNESTDRFRLSKVITFCPRFIVKNLTNRPLQWKQAFSQELVTCQPDETTPVQWMYRRLKKLICFRFPYASLEWSAPVSFDEIGQTYARMDPLPSLTTNSASSELLEVETILHKASLFMLVKLSSRWPFRVENLTLHDLEFAQVNATKARYSIPSGRSAHYAWDDPTTERILTLFVKGTEIGRNVNLFEIGLLQPWDFSLDDRRVILSLDLLVDGTTRVLQITPYLAHKSIYRQKETRMSSSSSSIPSFEVIDVYSIVKSSITFSLHLGISLVDSTRELLFVSLRDLNFKYSDTNIYQTYGLELHWIQIDNQLFNSNETIVLFPTELSKTSRDLHAVKLALVKSKDRSHGIQYFKYFSILLQEMSLAVDQALITALSEFFSWEGEEAKTLSWPERLQTSDPIPKDKSNLLYFEAFQIQPIKMNISFSANQSNSSTNVLSLFTKVISMGLGNIHNMPIKFNALTLEHPIGSWPILSDAIINHYSEHLYGNVYRVIGSADFLGNPVGLFNNLASGVQDIFYEPYNGIVSDRPQDLGIGLAKGTATFVGKAVYGVADGFAKFTGAVGKGLAMATLDENFQQARQISRARNRPKHAIYGVTTGAKSLAKGVVSGVTGVVMKPLEGAEEGVGGFFKGIGKGIVGLAAKPVVGFFDMASNISEGIKNTTTVFDDSEIDRMRLPRFIGEDFVLRPFSEREALGQSWLKQLENGQYSDHHYVAHLGTFFFFV
jgi:vacuolar protein sorting-associated protein 13A/C